jgi:CheY-like chemotaxis protein
MRGEISGESEPGSGSRFCLRIPFETVEDAPPAVLARADEPAPTARHLLLVEDNALNQLVLSRLLERLGCSVEVASNGLVALECVRTHAYDAILMDCQMPELDGYDATRAIRGMPEPVRATPIMGVTASAGERDRDRCLEAGMDDYLPKPVTLESLRRALDRLCRQPGQLSDTSAAPPLPDAASR